LWRTPRSAGGYRRPELPAAGRAAAAAITDNEAWKAERPGQMKIAREGLVAAIKGIIE